jgi:hypothetical protein
MRFLTNTVPEIFKVKLEGPWGPDPGWGAKFDSEIGDFIPDWEGFTKESQ